jgi:hypothetical protein
VLLSNVAGDTYHRGRSSAATLRQILSLWAQPPAGLSAIGGLTPAASGGDNPHLQRRTIH